MKKNKKIREGVVVSDKMDKTVKVQITNVMSHPLFGKIIREHSTLTAHDEKNECKTGYKVRLIENKPISKFKKWRVTHILERPESVEE